MGHVGSSFHSESLQETGIVCHKVARDAFRREILMMEMHVLKKKKKYSHLQLHVFVNFEPE